MGRRRTDTQVALQDRRCVPDQAQELDDQHSQLLVSLGRFVMIMWLSLGIIKLVLDYDSIASMRARAGTIGS